jgi:hypothetical protein
LTKILSSNTLSSLKILGAAMNLNEDLFKKLPFQVGNIVEVNKDRVVSYGKIEEVAGRFKNDVLGKSVQIYYRINNELIEQSLVTRKVSEQ